MGKKRRLKSAKAKFAAKHANHPRAKLLLHMTTEPIKVEVSEKPLLPEVEEIVPVVSLTPKTVAPTIKATVKAPTTTTKTAPKTTKPKKTAKKTTTRSRKTTNPTKPRAKSKKES